MRGAKRGRVRQEAANLGVVDMKFSYGLQARYLALVCPCQINKQRAKPEEGGRVSRLY